MKTQYASGRTQLPAPSLSAATSGNILGGGNTYYFWIKAKNRVGYNNVSDVTSLSIVDNRALTITASSFSTQSWEDWRYITLSVSTTNDYTTSRVIYKQNLYEEDQVTPLSLSDITISEDYILNSTGEVSTTANFPTINVPEGYRVKVLGLNKVYEYTSSNTLAVDNINVFSGAGAGRWIYSIENSLTPLTSTANKELAEVSQEEFLSAPLESFLTTPVPLKYYIVNDGSNALTVAQLFLNEYSSNPTVLPSFFVTILGYLNLSTFSLDTSGITNLGIAVEYPANNIALSKALPAGSAFVISITPDVITSSEILKGTYVSLYPLLAPYSLINEVKDWSEPVADIATLKALNPIQIKDGQTRLVKSVNKKYSYSPTSTLADNGTTVISPNGSPASGRWLAESTAVLPDSIGVEELDDEVLGLLGAGLNPTTITINTPTTYVIDLDTTSNDYFIINTPLTDAFLTGTTINVTATLENNDAKAIVLEIRQSTSAVSLDASIVWPGNTPPLLSGTTKTDLVVVYLVKAGDGVLKKRALLVAQDIG